MAFGVADSRELMIQGAESVYKRLLGSKGDSELLSFDTIALLAVKSDGNLDEEKLKELIRVFRPDRDGRLSLIDFAKSIDAVYKGMFELLGTARSKHTHSPLPQTYAPFERA